MSYTYLACPYSHPDESVRIERFEAVTRYAAELMRWGWIVFSPISHSHPMTKYGLPGDYTFWKRMDEAFVAASERVVVLRLDGWQESEGVAREIRYAEERKIPVIYVSPMETDA